MKTFYTGRVKERAKLATDFQGARIEEIAEDPAEDAEKN
jgi:hypothetical protein